MPSNIVPPQGPFSPTFGSKPTGNDRLLSDIHVSNLLRHLDRENSGDEEFIDVPVLHFKTMLKCVPSLVKHLKESGTPDFASTVVGDGSHWRSFALQLLQNGKVICRIVDSMGSKSPLIADELDGVVDKVCTDSYAVQKDSWSCSLWAAYTNQV